jgi:L-fucose mutarotase
MLIGIDPLLTPQLLWSLAAMGHGDVLALVDANHPAERIAAATGRPLIHLPGLDIDAVARAILGVMPLDLGFDDACVKRMSVVGDPLHIPAVQQGVQALLQVPMVAIEREAFYAQAQRAFCVVQVGDARAYGCFLLRKGVIKLA